MGNYLNEVKQNIKTLKFLTENNSEMRDIQSAVKGYRTEREQGKDGIRYISQSFWYGNQLARRAMEARGIILKETYSVHDKKDKPMAFSMGNGNHKRITYNDKTVKKKVYYAGEKPMLKVRTGLEEEYILADTRHVNSKTGYCENCGALNRLTEDYAGCEYCGTPMRMKEIHNKLVSVQSNLSGDWYQKILLGAVFLIMVFVCLLATALDMKMEGLFSEGITVGNIIYLLLTSLLPAGIMAVLLSIVLGNLLYVPILLSIHNSGQRVATVGFHMRKRDANFSDTEFYGIIQSYVKLWFLSKNRRELGCIAEIDNYVDDSVIDADCLACKGQKVWEDDIYTYIQMKLQMRLVKIHGEKLKAVKQLATVTMKRKRGALSSLATETFTCPSCGSSVNILEGSKCSYCGRALDMVTTDWVLHNVETE
ncbi:MAG: hypothetical protein K2G89_11060 [Lachnospiraceae bacterium]|nr:hypothetical protein [Lachnospiraceae bacterium]